LIEQIKPKRRIGIAKGQVKIAEDFDEGLKEFQQYSKYPFPFNYSLLLVLSISFYL